jgi:hypothetical protein
VTLEGAATGILIGRAVYTKKGGVVPIDETGKRMSDPAGEKGHPRRSGLICALEECFHRPEDKEVGGMPVFPVAAVRENEIGPLKVDAELTGEDLGGDIGSKSSGALCERVDVPEKDQIVNPEFRATLLHLGGADLPDCFAGEPGAGPALASRQTKDRDVTAEKLQFADEPRTKDLVVRMRHHHNSARGPGKSIRRHGFDSSEEPPPPAGTRARRKTKASVIRNAGVFLRGIYIKIPNFHITIILGRSLNFNFLPIP